MNKTMIRTAIVAASVAALGAGSTMLAGTASAAGDLRVTTETKCVVSHDKPGHDRTVFVTNVGNQTIKNVRIGIVGGPEVGLPAMAPDTEIGPRTTPAHPGHGIARYYTATGIAKRGELAPGESVKYWNVQAGCPGGAAVIAGYAIGSPVDNVFNAPNADIRFGSVR